MLYISSAKPNRPRTPKQIKGVQNLHNKLCAYYDGREVFELEGSEESCLDSTILKITSRSGAPDHVCKILHALSAAIILCWTID